MLKTSSAFYRLRSNTSLFNHLNPSILFVGKAVVKSCEKLFAENGRSTSLQRVAAQRVVSFSAKAFSTKRIWGLKWLNEWDPYLFTLIKVKIDLTIIMFLHHPVIKKIRFRFKFDESPSPNFGCPWQKSDLEKMSTTRYHGGDPWWQGRAVTEL